MIHVVSNFCSATPYDCKSFKQAVQTNAITSGTILQIEETEKLQTQAKDLTSTQWQIFICYPHGHTSGYVALPCNNPKLNIVDFPLAGPNDIRITAWKADKLRPHIQQCTNMPDELAHIVYEYAAPSLSEEETCRLLSDAGVESFLPKIPMDLRYGLGVFSHATHPFHNH